MYTQTICTASDSRDLTLPYPILVLWCMKTLSYVAKYTNTLRRRNTWHTRVPCKWEHVFYVHKPKACRK